jgi:hypothetical protein
MCYYQKGDFNKGAASPTSVIEVFRPLSGSSVNGHFATDLEVFGSFSLCDPRQACMAFLICVRGIDYWSHSIEWQITPLYIRAYPRAPL